jgi:hypothetical protein
VGKWRRGKRKGGWLLASKGPEWMGIRHQEQDTGPPPKFGIFVISARGLINDCLYIVSILIDCSLCTYKDFCVQVKNKPCVGCITIMGLIYWIRSRGSKTVKASRLERKYEIE